MSKLMLSVGALAAMLAVALGAFGAHGLRDRLDAYAMGVFETAVQYHFYHAFALLVVGLLALHQGESPLLRSSGYLFMLGLVLFSGSLYILSLSGLRWLGAITPLGGLAFLAAWACLALSAWKSL